MPLDNIFGFSGLFLLAGAFIVSGVAVAFMTIDRSDRVVPGALFAGVIGLVFLLVAGFIDSADGDHPPCPCCCHSCEVAN